MILPNVAGKLKAYGLMILGAVIAVDVTGFAPQFDAAIRLAEVGLVGFLLISRS